MKKKNIINIERKKMQKWNMVSVESGADSQRRVPMIKDG